MSFNYWLLQCKGLRNALMHGSTDGPSSGLENVVSAVWRPDPVQQAGAGDCEARGITEYFWLELGGHVAQCINTICSPIPLKQLMTVSPTGQCSSWLSKIAM